MLWEFARALQVPPGKWLPPTHVGSLPNFGSLGIRVIDLAASEPFASLNPAPLFNNFIHRIQVSGLFQLTTLHHGDPINRFVVNRGGIERAYPGDYVALKPQYLTRQLPPQGGPPPPSPDGPISLGAQAWVRDPRCPSHLWLRPTTALPCPGILIGVIIEPSHLQVSGPIAELAKEYRRLLQNSTENELVAEFVEWCPGTQQPPSLIIAEVWEALRGMPWMPPGNITMRAAVAPEPPHAVSAIGIAPQGVTFEGLWLAATGAAALACAVEALEHGRESYEQVCKFRLPAAYDAQEALAVIKGLTTLPTTDDVPHFIPSPDGPSAPAGSASGQPPPRPRAVPVPLAVGTAATPPPRPARPRAKAPAKPPKLPIMPLQVEGRATSGYKTTPNGVRVLVRGAEAEAKDYIFVGSRIVVPLLVGEVSYKQCCRRYQGGVCPYVYGTYMPGTLPVPGQTRDNTCPHFHACAYCGEGGHGAHECAARNRWLASDPVNRLRPSTHPPVPVAPTLSTPVGALPLPSPKPPPAALFPVPPPPRPLGALPPPPPRPTRPVPSLEPTPAPSSAPARPVPTQSPTLATASKYPYPVAPATPSSSSTSWEWSSSSWGWQGGWYSPYNSWRGYY